MDKSVVFQIVTVEYRIKDSRISDRYRLISRILRKECRLKIRWRNRFVSLVDYVILSTVNKPPEEQNKRARETKRGRHARTPEARGAGRRGNYVRNSLARVNIKRDRGRARTHMHAYIHTHIYIRTRVIVHNAAATHYSNRRLKPTSPLMRYRRTINFIIESQKWQNQSEEID